MNSNTLKYVYNWESCLNLEHKKEIWLTLQRDRVKRQLNQFYVPIIHKFLPSVQPLFVNIVTQIDRKWKFLGLSSFFTDIKLSESPEERCVIHHHAPCDSTFKTTRLAFRTLLLWTAPRNQEPVTQLCIVEISRSSYNSSPVGVLCCKMIIFKIRFQAHSARPV